MRCCFRSWYILCLLLSLYLSCSEDERNNESWSETPREVQVVDLLIHKVASGTRVYLDDLETIKNDTESLRLLRSSIYAKHGYIFDDEKLSAYFRRYSWYFPTFQNVEEKLSEVEHSLVSDIGWLEYSLAQDELLKKEASFFRGFLSLIESDMVGIWQTSPVAASGWTETLTFFPNRRVIERKNQMDGLTRQFGRIGDWKLSDGKLSLRFTNKVMLVGGKKVESFGSIGTPEAIINDFPQLLNIVENEDYDVSITYDIRFEKLRLTLNDRYVFWKMETDPNDY